MIPTAITSIVARRLAYALFHPPRKPHHRDPADVGLRATPVTEETIDGIDLHLWLIPGHGIGTVIIGHGIGLTKSASLRHARLAHELGYHVVLFDHRNHGRSGGDRSSEHLAERYSNDVATCAAVAARTWSGSPRLVVWGFSFSTFPTLHSLRHPTTPIDAVICDSGPGEDLAAMLRHFLAGGNLRAPALLTRLLRRPEIVDAFADSAVRMLGAEWPPPATASAAMTAPMLFIIGSADEVVQPEQVRAVAKHYPHATLVELPVGHLRGFKDATSDYAAAVANFLGSATVPRTT